MNADLKEYYFVDGKTSVKYLQTYIRQKDYHPKLKKDYFLKLSEEVGELAQAMRKDVLYKDSGNIKGTIDEEIWDVIIMLWQLQTAMILMPKA